MSCITPFAPFRSFIPIHDSLVKQVKLTCIIYFVLLFSDKSICLYHSKFFLLVMFVAIRGISFHFLFPFYVKQIQRKSTEYFHSYVHHNWEYFTPQNRNMNGRFHSDTNVPLVM